MNITRETPNAMALLHCQREIQEHRKAIDVIDAEGCNKCFWLPDGIPDHYAYLTGKLIELRTEFARLQHTDGALA